MTIYGEVLMIRMFIYGFFFSIIFGVFLHGEAGLKYKIDVKLDHNLKTLSGTEVIVWKNNTEDTVEKMLLHLYWNGFRNEMSAVGREFRDSGSLKFVKRAAKGELGWIDIKSISPIKGKPRFLSVDGPSTEGDQTVMEVFFQEPLKPGETVELNLKFVAKIPRTIMRTGYYQNGYFISQWFPKPGVYIEGEGWNCHNFHKNSEFFAPFADFLVNITVPRDFVVGATGKEIEALPNDSGSTKTYTFSQNMVHDFAWTADPDYIKVERDFIESREVSSQEYRSIAEKLNIDPEELKLSDVKMVLLINPEHKDQIEDHFYALKGALKYYGLWYGRYPYGTITLVDPPFRTGAGGMEYPTLITGGTTYNRVKSGIIPGYVIVHEMGHNFWYGLCANNEFEEAWLDEGINSYSDAKVMDKIYGKQHLPIAFFGIPMERYFLNFKIDKHLVNRSSCLWAVKKDSVFTNSWEFSSGGSYSQNVYGRAATVLKTLENILGESMMLKVMRTFQQEFRYKHPRTRDFIDLVNRVTGRDFNGFFRSFMDSTMEFDYGVESVKSVKIKAPAGIFDINGKKVNFPNGNKNHFSQSEGLYRSTITLRNFGELIIGGDLKLKLKAVFEDGSTRFREWNGRSPWKRFRFTGKYPLKYAELDPQRIYLVDRNLTNNSKKTCRDSLGSLRWGNKLLFWVQNLLMLVASAG